MIRKNARETRSCVRGFPLAAVFLLLLGFSIVIGSLPDRRFLAKAATEEVWEVIERVLDEEGNACTSSTDNSIESPIPKKLDAVSFRLRSSDDRPRYTLPAFSGRYLI